MKTKRAETNSALGPYRVLDLADEQAFACGRILGDLGADVIKVERPGGDPSRGINSGDKVLNTEKKLFWLAYNVNKRAITLNIETVRGQKIFRELARTADFVIESFAPGYLETVGLDFSILEKVNPRIVMTSVTPFGPIGPYREYKGSDLVTTAMSGYLYVIGDTDRPPVRISVPQAFVHAGAEAAVATLAAHYHRELTGEGQHVDVSIQASVARNQMNAALFWEVNRSIIRRAGPYRVGLSTTAAQRIYWPCKDGYVSFALISGSGAAPSNRALVDWMKSEGFPTDSMEKVEWEAFDMALATQEQFDQFEREIAAFFVKHTKKELYEESLNRYIMLCPLNTVDEILEDPQLKARGFWNEITDLEKYGITLFPGAFARLSESPIRIRFGPPLVGQHNEQIYGEIGLSKERMMQLKRDGVI